MKNVSDILLLLSGLMGIALLLWAWFAIGQTAGPREDVKDPRFSSLVALHKWACDHVW